MIEAPVHPRGIVTTYTPNALGDLLREDSPDSGSTRYEHDGAGLVIARTDARGTHERIERDALGRPTRITRTPAAGSDIAAGESRLIWDLDQIGHLARVEDASGSTDYERDAQGRILRLTQRILDDPANPTTLITRYSYTAGGRLASITYPSGLTVHYRRTASGQLSGIDTQLPGRNQPITPFISQLSWTPLGQPAAWTWFNGKRAHRSYDADARITETEHTRYQYDAAGRITQLSQDLQVEDAAAAAPGQQSTLTLQWSLEYDRRGRLTAMRREGAQSLYTWDANGNRTSAQERTRSDSDLDGDLDEADTTHTSTQSARIDPMSNRLLGITQENTRSKGNRTTAHSSTAITYGLDAAGNLTHDGLRQLRYGADNHLSAVRIHKDGEEAQVTYLNNTLGQRIFKSEPQASQTRPQAQSLGQDFIAWLKKNFAWLFEQAQRSASLGTSHTWASGPMPAWALLGQYDNGSAKGKGRSEYLWLPIEASTADTDTDTATDTATAIPIGLIRNNRRYALHSDHLGSVRRLSDEEGQTQWQWPYSAFGANPPSGPLKATAKPDKAMTAAPQLLKATSPKLELDLRYPGQMADEHSALHDNWQRQYQPLLGRYDLARVSRIP